MVYLALDTCVWLDLIKADTSNPHTLFDEVMFWFENDHAVCITTQNMVNEWHRNKEEKKRLAVSAIDQLFGKSAKGVFSTETTLDSMYTPSEVEKKINERISRIDALLSNKAEVGIETDDIFIKAAKSALDCIAPNHKKDSFRDTVNYMTLIQHIKLKRYGKCYFATINHKDFSDPGKDQFTLHPQLVSEFSNGGLEYHFFVNDKGSFGGKLFNSILTKSLPRYRDHLKKKLEEEQQQKIQEAARERVVRMEENDPEFMKNSLRIDQIANKKEPDDIDKLILKHLFAKHPAYEAYFYRKLAENDMV